MSWGWYFSSSFLCYISKTFVVCLFCCVCLHAHVVVLRVIPYVRTIIGGGTHRTSCDGYTPSYSISSTTVCTVLKKKKQKQGKQMVTEIHCQTKHNKHHDDYCIITVVAIFLTFEFLGTTSDVCGAHRPALYLGTTAGSSTVALSRYLTRTRGRVLAVPLLYDPSRTH